MAANCVPNAAIDKDGNFILSFDSHCKNLISGLANIFDKKEFLDCTLVCENVKFKCHKIILSACSEFFNNLCRDNDSNITIVLPKEVKKEELSAILQFMYTGQLLGSSDFFERVLAAARILEVREILSANTEIIIQDQIYQVTAKKTLIHSNDYEEQSPSHELSHFIKIEDEDNNRGDRHDDENIDQELADYENGDQEMISEENSNEETINNENSDKINNENQEQQRRNDQILNSILEHKDNDYADNIEYIESNQQENDNYKNDVYLIDDIEYNSSINSLESINQDGKESTSYTDCNRASSLDKTTNYEDIKAHSNSNDKINKIITLAENDARSRLLSASNVATINIRKNLSATNINKIKLANTNNSRETNIVGKIRVKSPTNLFGNGPNSVSNMNKSNVNFMKIIPPIKLSSLFQQSKENQTLTYNPKTKKLFIKPKVVQNDRCTSTITKTTNCLTSVISSSENTASEIITVTTDEIKKEYEDDITSIEIFESAPDINHLYDNSVYSSINDYYDENSFSNTDKYVKDTPINDNSVHDSTLSSPGKNITSPAMVSVKTDKGILSVPLIFPFAKTSTSPQSNSKSLLKINQQQIKKGNSLLKSDKTKRSLTTQTTLVTSKKTGTTKNQASILKSPRILNRHHNYNSKNNESNIEILRKKALRYKLSEPDYLLPDDLPSPSSVVLRSPRCNQPRTYSTDSLYAALMDVKSGESIYRASQIHNVPRKTLRNWMKRWHIKSAYPMPRQLRQAAEKRKIQKSVLKSELQ